MRRFLGATSIVLLALLSSCYVPVGGSSNTVTSQDLQSFQRVFMSSYYSSSGGTPSGARALSPFLKSVDSSNQSDNARATISVGSTSSGNTKNFSTVVAAGSTGTSISNYPQTGQTTVFVVTKVHTSPDVYDIKATTSFPSGDVRKTYVEEYYVKDVQPSSSTADGIWSYDDPIVQDAAGTTQNQSARVLMRLTFTDGTYRDETIVSDSGNSGPKFASFSVQATDSLDLSQAFVPTTSTASTINYSSVVVYETHPATNQNFWFWAGSTAQTIVGIRYYTEEYASSGYATGSNTLNATSISFERTVSSSTGTSGSLASTLQTISGGSTVDTLAESVFREKTSWPTNNGTPNLDSATVTKYLQTRVINIAGQKDFYLSQLNSDYVSLSSWASGTKYTPTGAVNDVVATDSSALLFNRSTLTSGISGAAPYAVVTSNLASSNIYGQAYVSITDGTYTVPATTPVPTSNVSSGTVLTFNGQQVTGSSIAYNPDYKLGKTGAVEAWIYLNSLTDTMGIVHYGTSTDFSDEGYSLQGWGSNGQITMLVDWANGQYDQVLSKTLLKTGKWYHIVGAWDFTASKPYIALYINGKLDNTNKAPNSTLVSLGSQAASDPSTSNKIMVGSQLPSSYSTQYGYFGVNGKIVGVNIKKLDDVDNLKNYNSLTATPTQTDLTAAVLSVYNANVGYTSGW